MPSLNAIRLFNALQPTAGTRVSSPIVRLQGVREETVTVWARVSGNLVSGTLEIRVAPDDAARALTTPAGMLLHSITWSGTSAGSSQTKVNSQGHAVVTVPAFPLFWLDIQGTSGTEIVTAYVIE